MPCVFSRLFMAALLLIPTVMAAPASSDALVYERDSSAPLPPKQDPWYSAPDGFQDKAPGTILRIRTAPGNLTAVASNCSATYNILYRTTDSKYKPSWAVTTVFVPLHPVSALLSYQIPYDSADLDASPSYVMYNGVSIDVKSSLAKGWFVNVPDYEGPLASFTAGVNSGHATIDSIRAVFNAAKKLGLDHDAKYAMWGYSGGALASEWAAELQAKYAPEMDFSGAALGGLTPNVTSVLLTINKGYAAGLAPAGILGLTSQYPDVLAYVISRLKPTGPYNRTTFLEAYTFTLAESSAVFGFQDISQYFIGGFADLIENPLVTKVIDRDGIMGYHGVPQMPIFAYKAIADFQSLIEDTDKLVDDYCDAGANIFYQRNTIGGHSAESVNGRPAAEAWLNSVLGGTYGQIYPTLGCTIQNVTVNITSSPL